MDEHSGLLRADRVEITPLHFVIRHFTGNPGQIGDLGLLEDGTVIYVPVSEAFDKPWTASIETLGAPGAVPESYVRWRSIAYWQNALTVRHSSMTLSLPGPQRRIVRFTGVVPPTSLFWKAIDKIPLPHHLGLATKTAFVVKLTVGSGGRANDAATWWREALEAWQESGLQTEPPIDSGESLADLAQSVFDGSSERDSNGPT
jgi:hypothetical protein